MSHIGSKLLVNLLLIYCLLIKTTSGFVPTPDHVVVLMLENHGYFQIVGNSNAPYINSLINDNMSALFTQSYALTHPSQPNYLLLFSGLNQGVTNDAYPANTPFTTPNLGAQLHSAGKSFVGYSQSLPSVGFTGGSSGAYASKHSPWVFWQGSSSNGLPATSNQPFTAFPANYDLLPNVSFVIPDQDHDMHNGTDPARITTADTWIQNNLNGYIQWAKTHNSLLILTFDEDNNNYGNQILTLFLGPMVQHGNYSMHVDHFNILRTIEDMYGLGHAGFASSASPIDYCWSACGPTPIITASGPTTFCLGDSVTLTAPAATSYLWCNGMTTQAITVDTSADYYVLVNGGNGCTVISNTIVVNANLSPVINSFTPTGAPVGSAITFSGNYLSAVTDISFNGISASFAQNNNSLITAFVPIGASSGPVTITNNCGTGQSVDTFSVIAPTIFFTVKLFIEGYYIGSGQMASLLDSTACDTITLNIYDDEDPDNLIYTTKSIVSTDGFVTFPVGGSAYSKDYFISVHNRNCLKTWSAVPVHFGLNTLYDFTTSASTAFGNKLKLVGSGNYALISGDVNQDNQISMSDLNEMRFNLRFFIEGYHRDDITGDGLVESTDFSLIENNVPTQISRP